MVDLGSFVLPAVLECRELPGDPRRRRHDRLGERQVPQEVRRTPGAWDVCVCVCVCVCVSFLGDLGHACVHVCVVLVLHVRVQSSLGVCVCVWCVCVCVCLVARPLSLHRPFAPHVCSSLHCSTEHDHIFVNFADHGGPECLAFPGKFVEKFELIDSIKKLHSKKMYKQVCENIPLVSIVPAWQHWIGWRTLLQIELDIES